MMDRLHPDKYKTLDQRYEKTEVEIDFKMGYEHMKDSGFTSKALSQAFLYEGNPNYN